MINKNTLKKINILFVILLTVALASLIITSITPFFNIREGLIQEQEIDIGTSSLNTWIGKGVLNDNITTVSNIPISAEGVGWVAQFSATVNGNDLTVERTDGEGPGWGQHLKLLGTNGTQADTDDRTQYYIDELCNEGETPINGFDCINSSGGYELKKDDNDCISLTTGIDIGAERDCNNLLTKYHNERVTVHAACNNSPELVDQGKKCHPVYEQKQGTVGSLGSLIVNDITNTLNFKYCPTAPTPGTYEKWSNCYVTPSAV